MLAEAVQFKKINHINENYSVWIPDGVKKNEFLFEP